MHTYTYTHTYARAHTPIHTCTHIHTAQKSLVTSSGRFTNAKNVSGYSFAGE